MTTPPTDLLGAHVSVSGGVQTGPERAALIGATALQVFTKTPNQWREPEVSDETAAAFRAAMDAHGMRAVVSHDSYLINLASPDEAQAARSTACMVGELTRCHRLGIPAVVSHPGNFMDDREAGILRNAARYATAIRQAPGDVIILLETTAGSGTALGSRFEELAALRDAIPTSLQHRIGYCADTCHLYSAGYDLVGDYDGVWEAFHRICGLEHLRCFHLNDSKTPFASRKDRHELVGQGSLGPEPFRRLMRDPRFAHVMKVLETPKGDDEVTNDRDTLAQLRRWAA